MKIRHLLCAPLCASIILTGSVSAQEFPVKPIRLVVPYPPGSPSDILGRIISIQLATSIGKGVIIDNRPGAGGVVGLETVAAAAPDGYTLLVGGTGALTINPGLQKKLSYDPVNDFTPISLVASVPFLLVSSPATPVRTVADVIALAKAKPRQLNYASKGIGSPPHLAAELFKIQTGTNIVHVAYKGSGPAIVDLMSDQVQVMFAGIMSVVPYIKSNRLKGIAVADNIRTPLLPNMPTVIESGLPGFTAVAWIGILAPAKTPTAVVNKLDSELLRVLRSADMKEKLLEQGAEPNGNTPEQFKAYMKAETIKYAKAIKAAGITAE